MTKEEYKNHLLQILDDLNISDKDSFSLEIRLLTRGVKYSILEKLENPTEKDIEDVTEMLIFLTRKILEKI